MAALGVMLSLVQLVVLRRHLRAAPGEPGASPPISILKPLCGIDDDLEGNLASFAALDYPAYEVLLGVRDRNDPAWRVAAEAVPALARPLPPGAPARRAGIEPQGEPAHRSRRRGARTTCSW